MAFVLHRDARGILALGGSGGSLGYGDGALNGVERAGLYPSVGVRFDTYTTTTASTIGLVTDGFIQTGAGEFASPFPFTSGNYFDVVLTWSASNNNLTAVVSENVLSSGIVRTFSRSWIVDIKQTLGCDTTVAGW